MRNGSDAFGRNGGPNFSHFHPAASYTGIGIANDNIDQLSSPYIGLIGTGVGSRVTLRDALQGTHARIIVSIGSQQTQTTNPTQVMTVVVPPAEPVVAQSAKDQVRFIQASMGLTVGQLASALGVERQTVYNWLQAERAPVLQTRTRNRLQQLADIARKWNERCSRPVGRLLTSLDVGGTTLLNLLSQTTIDDAAIVLAMDALAATVIETRNLRRGRLKTETPPPITEDDRILESATGIRLDTTQIQD
jgi:transcriptional regulator with XRE-family HTH domain